MGAIEREMLPEEKELLREHFGGTLSVDKIRLFEGGVLSYRSTRTVGFNIYFDPTSNWFGNRKTWRGRHTLVHEAGHCWEYEHDGGLLYIPGSLFAQGWSALKEKVREIRTGADPTPNRPGRAGAYAYTLRPVKHFSEYGPEQKAEIIADYYVAKNVPSFIPYVCDDFQTVGRDRALAIYERLRMEMIAMARGS